MAVADNWFGWQQHARGMGGPAGIAHTGGTGLQDLRADWSDLSWSEGRGWW